jgi:hypothetical protein
VLDYRGVNARSMPDRYSIKEARECIDEIGRSDSDKYSCIDLTSGFLQMELEEESRQYTAFSVPGKAARFHWCLAPMGLQGSPASIARLMDYVMQGILGVLTYIDDVLVHNKGHEEHLRTVEEVLLRLRKYGLKLNADKSIFGATTVQYLGYSINEDGVTLSTDKMAAIRETRLNRLQYLMLEYDFTIKYRVGEDNSVADYWSRNATTTDTASVQEQVSTLNILFPEAEMDQSKDELMVDIIRNMKTGNTPEKAQTQYKDRIKRLEHDSFLDEENRLWYRLPGKTRERIAFWTPRHMRKELMVAAHVSIEAGHGGVARTVARLQSNYYWAGMSNNATNFVKTCRTCQLSKTPKPAKQPLQPLEVCDRANQRLHIDLKWKPPPPPQYCSRWMRRQQTATMGTQTMANQPCHLGHQDGGAQPGSEARDGVAAGNLEWVSSARAAQEAVGRMLEEVAPRIGYCHECGWWHELPRCYSFETSVRTGQQEHGQLAGRASA